MQIMSEDKMLTLDNILEDVRNMPDEQVEEYINNMQNSENRNSNLPESETQDLYSGYHPSMADEEVMSTAFEISNNTYSWKRAPQMFLVSVKPNDPQAEEIFASIITELKRNRFQVLLDPIYAPKYQCQSYTKQQLNTKEIDLVIVVGGDGSLLYLNTLFPQSCPPVVVFNAGSLGFLAPFQASDNLSQIIQHILNGPLIIVPRMRIQCYVQKYKPKIQQSKQVQQNTHETQKISHFEFKSLQMKNFTESGRNSTFSTKSNQKKNNQQETPPFLLFTNRPPLKFNPPINAKIYTAINEVYINRGSNNALTNLQCYSNGYYFGTIQADGLLISTPTGSTAYALSAGGVPVLPTVNCILFTPVCPHVMSSKQLILNTDLLKIKISQNSRGSAMVCFDGRNNIELLQGDSVVISTSPHSIPTVSLFDGGVDWFQGLKRCLNWNVRIEQKKFGSSEQERNIERPREVWDIDSDLE